MRVDVARKVKGRAVLAQKGLANLNVTIYLP
jgi:hypothetical protein